MRWKVNVTAGSIGMRICCQLLNQSDKTESCMVMFHLDDGKRRRVTVLDGGAAQLKKVTRERKQHCHEEKSVEKGNLNIPDVIFHLFGNGRNKTCLAELNPSVMVCAQNRSRFDASVSPWPSRQHRVFRLFSSTTSLIFSTIPDTSYHPTQRRQM